MSLLSLIFESMISAKDSKNAKFYRVSILIWVLFMLYESTISYFLSGKSSPIADYVNAYTVNILLFYTNAYLVLPWINKKPIYIGIIAIIVEAAVYIILKFCVAETFFLLSLTKIAPLSNLRIYIIQTIWRFIYFMGLSSGYWFALNIIRQRKEISDLEKNKLMDQLNTQQLEKKLVDSDIAYLKSQINPHFLFNTLNFLYNSTLKEAPNLSQPVLLLSDIMRYALTETPQSGKVNLEDELEQINTFIALNQYRYDHNLNLSLNISGNPENHKILPLILLTPVENIFKYADLKNKEYPAMINIDLKGNLLNFIISNRKLKSKRALRSHGIGLKNLKLRLDVYYADAHHIQVSEDIDNYVFELQLTL